MKRLVIYSHDTFGLGNMRRMTTIAEHLVAQYPSLDILLISGSAALPAFDLPKRIDYVKLPCLARDEHGNYGAKSLDMSLASLVNLRANLILNAVLDFQPELFLVDKKPYGVHGELEPVLKVLAARPSRPHTVLVLRDILDEAHATRATWAKMGYHDAIAAHYESVLVVGDPQVFDLAEEYGFPPATRERLHYCGYLRKTARVPSDNRDCKRDRPVVLVTPGGGQDGAMLVSAFLHGVSANAREYESAVYCGPELDTGEAGELHRRARNAGVTWHRFTMYLPALMRHADALVTMAGYNTITEGLSLGKPMVVIPRNRPTREQQIRAERLAGLGSIHMIRPEDLTPATLDAQIDQALREGTPAGASMLDFNGLNNVQAALAGLLG